MSDLIERKDATKALYDAHFKNWGNAVMIIQDLPSADRPRGEWEKIGEDTYYHRCPYCKRTRAFEDSRFCDWCGAKMKGADDE